MKSLTITYIYTFLAGLSQTFFLRFFLLFSRIFIHSFSLLFGKRALPFATRAVHTPLLKRHRLARVCSSVRQRATHFFLFEIANIVENVRRRHVRRHERSKAYCQLWTMATISAARRIAAYHFATAAAAAAVRAATAVTASAAALFQITMRALEGR